MRQSAVLRCFVAMVLACLIADQPALLARQGATRGSSSLRAHSQDERSRRQAKPSGAPAISPKLHNTESIPTARRVADAGIPDSGMKQRLPVSGGKPGGQSGIFIENQGQWDDRVRFQIRSGRKTIWLTKTGVVVDAIREQGDRTGTNGEATLVAPHARAVKMTFPAVSPFPLDHRTPAPSAQASAEYERLVFSQEFVGAHGSPTVEAADLRPGRYNYLYGSDPAKWHTNVRGYLFTGFPYRRSKYLACTNLRVLA
jgi:hypothetical protein